MRYTVSQTEIGNSGSFIALLPPPPTKTKKIRILKKWKKLLKISSFYTCVPKTRIIWGTVPEIWSEADITFCHFRPFLPFYPPNDPENQKFEKMEKLSGDIIILHIYYNHMMYASWDMMCYRQNFLSFWTIFCSFSPLTT